MVMEAGGGQQEGSAPRPNYVQERKLTPSTLHVQHADRRVLAVAALSPEALMMATKNYASGFFVSSDDRAQQHLHPHAELLMRDHDPQVMRNQADDRSVVQRSNFIRRSPNYHLSCRVGVPGRVVYVCPEESCVHHHWSRGLSDLTGIRKHFFRKHWAQRKWRCLRCSKAYAVHSDWKAHSKICGNRQFVCESCGICFTRKDTFCKHRDYCYALAQERVKVTNCGTYEDATSNVNAEYISNSAEEDEECNVSDHVTQSTDKRMSSDTSEGVLHVPHIFDQPIISPLPVQYPPVLGDNTTLAAQRDDHIRVTRDLLGAFDGGWTYCM